jgi:hypothetical protein
MKIGLFNIKTEYEANLINRNDDEHIEKTTVTYEHDDIITETEGYQYLEKNYGDYEIEEDAYYITIDNNSIGPFAYEKYIAQIMQVIRYILVDESSQNSLSESGLKKC